MYQKIFYGPDPAASSRLRQQFRRATLACAALILLPAGLIMRSVPPAGSQLASGVDWLVWRWPAIALMLSALCILPLGLARSTLARRATGLTAALGVIAVMMVFGVRAGWQAGGLPNPDLLPGGGSLAGINPGWPLLSYLLLGIAGVTLVLERAVRVGQACALALLVLAGAHVLTHLYSGTAVVEVSALQSDSVLSCLGLLASACGLLCGRAGTGLLRNLTSPTSAGVLERRLLPVAALFPIVVGWLKGIVEGERILAPPVAESLFSLILIAALVGALRYTGSVLAATEAQVSGERERLRRLLLAHGHGLLLFERSGRVALANPALAGMFGCTLDDLLGARVQDLLPGDALTTSGATQARRPDGTDLPVEVGLTPLDLDGQTYTLATVVDIRERRRLEQVQQAQESQLAELRRETERLLRGQVSELQALNSEIVRTSQSGLLVYRASGACLLANAAAARMVGSEVETLLTEDFRTVQGWRSPALVACAEAALAGRGPTEFETECQAPDRAAVQVAFTFSAVLAGATQYLVVHTQDVSSYIATQRELRVAGEAARQANDAKSMFIANMSHEIRTPMNAVLGLAYLLESDDTLRAEARATASRIRVAGRGLMGIVDDILDLSKIEAGQLEIERIPFSLSELFSRLATLLVGTRRSDATELILREPPDDVDGLIGDPFRLQQVLLNLAGNAFKFTRDGEIEIAADVLSREPRHVTLRLSVRDTGIGIPAALQSAIFEPFSQADSSTARRFGGTGLGLTICRKILTAMGGQIGVSSTPGAGSTFWCELRLERDLRVPLRPISPQGRALVVDAGASARAALVELLGKLGWRGDAAADGGAALALARQAQLGPGQAYGLLLIDASLDPAPDAPLVRALSALLAPEATVLQMGALGSSDIRFPLGGPVQAWLAKPLDSARLREACARAPAAVDSQPEARGRVSRDPQRPPADALAGIRALVVDDSETNLEVACRILERFGAHATMANSGSEALELLTGHPGGFDIVLMDIQMPELDGLEATRRLRANPRLASLPVIALSGGAMTDQVERAREAGMNDFLSKPFEARTLVETLLHWVPRERPAPLVRVL